MTKSRYVSVALRVVALVSAICAVGALAVCGAEAGTTPAPGPVNVTTYHYDNYRTGWNPNETLLNPGNVGVTAPNGKTLQMINFVALDDQVDAQPLIVTGQTIDGGVHDIVYVVTESNSIYAIDANTGTIWLRKTFGAPVPQSALPGGCGNNAANVGMGSTPVIDVQNGTMYVMEFYYARGTTPLYRLHALDLSTLNDIVPPVIVRASATLTNGKTYKFNPSVSRQRSALLLANGNVYAGFASYCDIDANLSRGWVLGWQTGTLTPLAHNEMTDKLATSTDDFFLSSIWMSGYGLASGGPNGDIYFVTGNSDYSGDSIDGVNNIGESTVQMSSDLSTVKSVFTPDNWSQLDNNDTDFGSGGALMLPPQPGQTSDLLVAAGKDGNMYFLNADNLNNNTTGPNRILGTYGIGGCWCGQSYFTSGGGIGYVVSSGNNSVGIWRVVTGAHPHLVNMTFTNGIPGSQDPGFFTAVSTNGAAGKGGIIWAVGRADGSSNEYISLNAFNAATGASLYSANAGTWPNTGGNANIVPVVANGKVYVASYQGLAIFGEAKAGVVGGVKIPVTAHAPARVVLAPGQHEIFGTVHAINGATVVVQKRDGTLVTVDALAAAKGFDLAPPAIGHGILVRGTYNPAGVMVASVVLHAKDHAAMWQPDR
jgi:hypothetical protein